MFFKPKIDSLCPDFWTAKINYLSGQSAEYKIVSQSAIRDGIMELITVDDIRVMVSFTNVLSVEFDKAYTKILEYRSKRKEAINA